MSYRINKYCYRLGRLLKNFEDKNEITNEIKVHLEEYANSFIEKGLDEKAAEKRAIKDMGNVYILAYKLNKFHKKSIIPVIDNSGVKPSVTYPEYFPVLRFSLAGLEARDIIKYGIGALVILFLFDNALIFSSKFKYYGFTDVYDFGKLYKVSLDEKTVYDDETVYSYSMNSISEAQIRNYKQELEKKGYITADESTFVGEKRTVVVI